MSEKVLVEAILVCHKLIIIIVAQFVAVNHFQFNFVLDVVSSIGRLDPILYCFSASWSRPINSNPKDVSLLSIRLQKELGPGLLVI